MRYPTRWAWLELMGGAVCLAWGAGCGGDAGAGGGTAGVIATAAGAAAAATAAPTAASSAAPAAAPAPIRVDGDRFIEGRVTAKNASLAADSVVYLETVRGDWKPPGTASMDQKGSTFVPRVLPILRGTTVRYDNTDRIEHSVYSPDGAGFDLGKWKEGARERAFDELGVYTHLCKIHPMMIGYTVVLQNPYFALTGSDGAFRIEGIPPGTYTLETWNERLKADPVEVAVTEGSALRVEIPLHR